MHTSDIQQQYDFENYRYLIPTALLFEGLGYSKRDAKKAERDYLRRGAGCRFNSGTETPEQETRFAMRDKYVDKDGYVSARACAQSSWNESPDGLSRNAVYNQMKPVAIDFAASPTSETRRQADWLFDRKIRQAAAFKSMKEHDKRIFWHRLTNSLKRAIYEHGCVMSPRDHNSKESSHANLQVVECAVEAGLVRDVRSPPGSPKMSRLVPLRDLRRITECDPWSFDPPDHKRQLIFLRDRETKDELEFDPSDPVATKFQQRLVRINSVNGRFRIFYTPFCEWDQSFESKRQLRPVHYAIFTDSFEQHGRLYTGRYGHQSLRKLERGTIEFELKERVLEPSVELDYGGLHPRLAYHLAGIDYQDDPYKLWGEQTTAPMRLMAKVLINASLNAKDAKSAINDCNRSMSRWTKSKPGQPKQRKRGEALAEAVRLFDAAQQTGLKFKEIHALAMRKHKKIADQFCTDAGMRLMRIDSELALAIMNHFAKQDVPCLGVHDSFIVPRTAKTELRRVMTKFYKRRLGFVPQVK